MKVEDTFIEGLKVIIPEVFFDKRGYFYEPYNENTFKENGLDMVFVQDNESKSDKDVLRGLHFQKPPFCQGKLIRVIKGGVMDVVVDLRKKSKTYGKYYKLILTEENKIMFYIPEGFAHGFLTLEDNTIFSYKCTNFYNKASEGGIMWNDKTLKINWNIINPIISDKDTMNESFIDFNSPF